MGCWLDHVKDRVVTPSIALVGDVGHLSWMMESPAVHGSLGVDFGAHHAWQFVWLTDGSLCNLLNGEQSLEEQLNAI
jgi:hypothetical protein